MSPAAIGPNRAARRAAAHKRRPLGKLPAMQLQRADTSEPMLQLLLHPKSNRVHAGIARGPGPGKPLCERHPSLFQHPLFARDPNFGPGVDADLRHLYALWTLRLNDGCSECQRLLIETGGDGEYPYLDPVKAE